MSYTKKVLENSEVELEVTVTPAEYAAELEKAAERLSARSTVHGFRPGKVPYDLMKKKVGDMAILQEAIEPIVRSSFFQTITAEKLDTIGMPKVDIIKAAPDNDFVYKATVALLPKVTLPKIESITVKREPKSIDDAKIEETLTALRGLQAAEAKVDRAAAGNDKLVIDMNMKLDHVPVEGGQAKDYQVYLSEDHYVPGFNKELVGLKAGDEKTFMLTFPETHYQKMLAGKAVEFTVKVKDVFERVLPELNDLFAAKLGQETVAALRELIRKNLEREAEQKAEEKAEIEIFDRLIAASTFDPIPEVLIDAERQKMFFELKRDLERHNVTIEQYLQDIKKKEDELFSEFKTQAEKRAKAALVSRELAREHSLLATPAEVDAEVAMMRETYKENPEYLENLKKPEVRDTIATMLQNRKVIGWLKERVLKNETL